MIDLRDLHLALVARDHGSFRKAAGVLGIRASVLSRRIRALEDELGVSLFHRISQGIQPTLAGQQLLSRAKIIVNDVDGLVRIATRRGGGEEGQLCIGVTASFAGGMANTLLTAYVAAYPDVEIEIVEGSRTDHLAKIRAFQMDVALRFGTEAVLGLDVEPLWSEPIHVAMPRSDPLALSATIRWEQLSAARFIVTKMDPGPEIEDCVIVHLAGLGRSPSMQTRAVRREGLLALVGLGLGITLVGNAEVAVPTPTLSFDRSTARCFRSVRFGPTATTTLRSDAF